MQLDKLVQIQLIVQNTKKKEQLPIIQMDRSQSLSISIFDHKNQTTIDCYNQIKMFTVARDYTLHYEQLEKLGSGSFATVYKVKEKTTGEIFAAKIYFRTVFEICPHK